MPTYVYETIPQRAGEKPQRFEIDQRMSEKSLERHPETGVPVRRVISGGAGILCEPRTASAGGHVHGPGCHH